MRLLLFLALLFTGAASADVAVPPLKARVTDLTQTLNAQQRAALEQTLAEFESRKGAQVAVLMVPTTEPETVEQYAVRVQEAWKLGRKGVDDGVLLLVAKNDRRLKIEVGYGLEGVLPDAIAKRIIEEDIVPRFRDGDFYGGIRAGTDRIMRVVEGEQLPPPRAHGGSASAPDWSQWLFMVFFAAIVAAPIVTRIFGRLLGAGIGAGALGAFAWVIAGSLAVALGAGALAFVIMLVVSLSPARSSGWGSGGWSSGGGGWGSSGGGFSGGGGSSGGGGASGRW